MKIAIASGKGGTGKTTVAVNFALSLDREVNLIDCDVEEPNSNIFLDIPMETGKEVNMKIPEIDEEICTHCGKCADLCEFNALAVLKDKVLLFEELCHACGLCSLGCPVDAISEKDRRLGVIEEGRKENINFYQGILDVGEAISTPIIRKLKESVSDGLRIFDVPPGTGCPVVESLEDADFALLVTEPTPFGLHDLQLSVDLVREMGIPFGVIINMAGTEYDKVEKYCEEENIPVLMEIPYSKQIATLYSDGVPFIYEMDEWKEKFKELYDKIEVML